MVSPPWGKGGTADSGCRTTRPARRGPALGTAAEELDALVRDAEPRAGRDPPAQRLRVRLGQGAVDVEDAAAAHAGEMVMRGQIGVEAGMRARDLRGQSLIDEQPQVSVHGAQADAGPPAPDDSVHPFGRRMRGRAAQHVEDGAARPGEPEAAGAQGRIGVLRNGSHLQNARYTSRRMLSRAPRGCSTLARSGRLPISGGLIGWRSPSGSGSRAPGRTT